MEKNDYWLIGDLKIPTKIFNFLVIIGMIVILAVIVGCSLLIFAYRWRLI